MITSNNKSGLFGYLLLLTAFFCLLEISLAAQRSGLYLGDFRLVSSHLTIPMTVVPGILFFVFAQLLVHVGFTVKIWAMARLLGVGLRLSWHQTQNAGFILWGAGIATVLLANQYYFPNSQFADLLNGVLPVKFSRYLLLLLIAMWIVTLVWVVKGLVEIILSIEKDLTIRLSPAARTHAAIKARHIKLLLLVAAISTTIMTISYYAAHQKTRIVADASTINRPNIILIGVDALRPDFLSYFGHSTPTPHFDDFLNRSTVFAEAITPIARTFPSWMTLLFGSYPKQTGVRFDLADPNQVDTTRLLPAILKRQGYHTVFAMDETRFSNMVTQFGFDRVLTPPTGFNDFLLGSFNDFPLSNLVVNTKLGHWLFPYSYANRPAYVTYNPNTFLHLLGSALKEDRTQPLFLAVHFCLPHFPYFWANSSAAETSWAAAHYQAAVSRVDQQVYQFLSLLEQDGVLAHSVVVLLSDHGEALELYGDRITGRKLFIAGPDNKNNKIPHFYPPTFNSEKVNQSAGHGTDVLSMSQYHTLLAFRLYGMGKTWPRAVPGIVSIMDIKPTLLTLLGIKHDKESGISLADVIKSKRTAIPFRHDFFIESDFSPQAVRSTHPEARKLLFEGIDFFQIDPKSTRLTVKKSMGDMIISSKQYANIHGAWILALYPQEKGIMMPILVNLKTGQWTNDLRTAFARQSPAMRMLTHMKDFYGNEISTVENIS
jgi:arylsulfatase A-like enzyme